MSFDIQFMSRNQKQRMNGEACRASPTCFWSSLINIYLKALVHGASLEDFKARIKKIAVLFKLTEVADIL